MYKRQGQHLGDRLAQGPAGAQVPGEQAAGPPAELRQQAVVQPQFGPHPGHVGLVRGEDPAAVVLVDRVERGDRAEREHPDRDQPEHRDGQRQAPADQAEHGPAPAAGGGAGAHEMGVQDGRFHHGPQVRPWVCGSTTSW